MDAHSLEEVRMKTLL